MASKDKRAVPSTMESLTVDGRERTFLVVPASHRPVAEDVPAVVLVLHGSSQNGRAIRTFSGHSFDKLAASGCATVVYPDGLRKAWNHALADANVADDVNFINVLIDHFRNLYGPVPIIITGYSNGGQLLIRLIHEIPDKFDGAAVLSATLPRPGGLAFEDKRLPLPVLLIHGTRDHVVRYGGEGSLWGRFAKNRGPSAPETAAYFAARNGITDEPTETTLPHRAKSGRTRVVARRYTQEGCEPVTLFTVVGGGHVVPNLRKPAIFVLGRTTQDLNAVQALTDFFPALHP